MAKQSLSILVEEDQSLPAPRAAGGALQSGLLALGTVMPTTLALVGIAYAPLALLGMPLNPLWCLWSVIAGVSLMLVLTSERGAIYAVRPGAALLYASTITTCVTLAPSLKLQPLGVLGLTAACMSLAGLVIFLSLSTGATKFARYLPAPVGRGLSLGFGLTILWLQAKTVFGWFVDGQWQFQASASSVVAAVLLAAFVYLVLQWRRRMPGMPYLLALLPIAVGVVWSIEYATGMDFGWVAAPALRAPADLLPPVLPPMFAAEVLRTDVPSAWWSAIATLVAQALFVAFTFMVDSAGNAATIESMTNDSYDLNEELRASALSMVVLPWFALLPVSSLVSATRPLYNSGIRNGRAIRLGNLVVVLGLAGLLGLVWIGLDRIPTLFVVAGLVVIGLNLLDSSLFSRVGKGVGERQMWRQTWLIGLVFVLWSGIFAMLAGFAVAVAQLVRGAEGTIIRSIFTLKEIRSRRWRSDEEEAILRRSAERAVVVALQGTASFAVARRIREEISRIVNPKQMDVLLIDAHRVTDWDLTALEAFKRMADEFQRTHVEFMISHPSADARRVLHETVRLFSNTDKALEWAENEIVRRQGIAQAGQSKPFRVVSELPMLTAMGDTAINALSTCGKTVAVASGQAVFNVGDADGSLLLVLAGNVSVEAAGGSETLRVATFGPGMVVGEMAFLDGSPRSARAVAVTSCLLFVLSRAAYAHWAQHYPADAQVLLSGLATQLSHRLRVTTGQLISQNP